MPHVAKQTTDLIIGQGLVAAEIIAQQLRKRLASILSKNYLRLPPSQLIPLARGVLLEFEPLLAQALADTEIAAWVRGLEVVTNRTPTLVLNRIIEGSIQPVGLTTDLAAFADPVVRFPKIEEGAERLLQSGIFTRDDFDILTAEAQREAFTVAGISSESTIGKIRDSIAISARSGETRRDFKARMEDAIGTSPIGPSHLDTVFRTGTSRLFAEGQESLASHPIMQEVFPYAAYSAIDDGRVRDDHIALETLGLNGTNIYRVDDPMWNWFTPPWSWNCLLPGTLVDATISAGQRVEYDGGACEVVTESGNRLSVTINHPVLTDEGWVPAGKLREGHNVFSHVFVRHSSAPAGDYQDEPSTAEDCFQSLSLLSEVAMVPCSRYDFNGDAARFMGDIDVVNVDIQLLNSSRDLCSDLGLVPVNAGLVGESSRGRFELGGVRASGAYGRVQHGRENSIRAFRGHVSPSDHLLFGRRSQLDAMLYQHAANHMPRNVELSGEGVNGVPFGVESYHGIGVNVTSHVTASESWVTECILSGTNFEGGGGSIAMDRVSQVRPFRYRGDVYDFTSSTGHLITAGIVTHNCRCGKTLLTIKQAARRGVVEARHWLNTGIAPATPEWRIDDIPFGPESGFVGPKRLSLFGADDHLAKVVAEIRMELINE